MVRRDELIKIIKTRIEKVKPETFRQREIIEEWEKIPEKEYKIRKYRFTLSRRGYEIVERKYKRVEVSVTETGEELS